MIQVRNLTCLKKCGRSRYLKKMGDKPIKLVNIKEFVIYCEVFNYFQVCIKYSKTGESILSQKFSTFWDYCTFDFFFITLILEN